MDNFLDLVSSVWSQGVFGIDFNNVLIGILILILFVLFRSLFSKIVVGRLKAIVKKSSTQIDDEVLEAFDGPLRFFPIVIGVYISTQYLNLNSTLEIIAANLNTSLITIQIFWFLYKVIDPFSFFIHKFGELLTYDLIDWGVRILKFFIFIIGGAAVLEIWGIKVGPILAGLGLLSVAVALGAQDLFKNLISGILVLVEKRFKMGDWILVEGIIEGIVERIGFRSTVIRKFDKSLAIIPNFQFAENAVINVSQTTNWLISWMITLQYDTTVDQLKTIRNQIEEHITNSEDFDTSIGIAVRIDKFSDSSIDMYVRCFSKTSEWEEWLTVKEKLALEIKQIVEKNGASFAFPSQSIYVEKK